MPRLFKRLLYTLAAPTDNELRKQIQFLKAENEILRSRLRKRVVLTTAERARLVKFGRPLGKAIRNLITIVTPETFKKWCRTGVNLKKKHSPTRKPGRPRTAWCGLQGARSAVYAPVHVVHADKRRNRNGCSFHSA